MSIARRARKEQAPEIVSTNGRAGKESRKFRAWILFGDGSLVVYMHRDAVGESS